MKVFFDFLNVWSCSFLMSLERCNKSFESNQFQVKISEEHIIM